MNAVPPGKYVCPFDHGPFDSAEIEVDAQPSEPICPECQATVRETF